MTILTIASLAVSAYSAVQQQRAQNAAAEYNRKVQLNNAQIAEMRAKSVEERGAVQEKQLRLQIAQKKGQQRSALAASGVVVDEGTALEILEDTAALGEEDALTLRHNTAMEAWGLRTQRFAFESQAELAGAQKSSAALAGTSSLLANVPSAYSNIYGRKRTTMTRRF